MTRPYLPVKCFVTKFHLSVAGLRKHEIQQVSLRFHLAASLFKFSVASRFAEEYKARDLAQNPVESTEFPLSSR